MTLIGFAGNGNKVYYNEFFQQVTIQDSYKKFYRVDSVEKAIERCKKNLKGFKEVK